MMTESESENVMTMTMAMAMMENELAFWSMLNEIENEIENGVWSLVCASSGWWMRSSVLVNESEKSFSVSVSTMLSEAMEVMAIVPTLILFVHLVVDVERSRTPSTGHVICQSIDCYCHCIHHHDDHVDLPILGLVVCEDASRCWYRCSRDRDVCHDLVLDHDIDHHIDDGLDRGLAHDHQSDDPGHGLGPYQFGRTCR
jgi:hypothetical protein